MIVVFGATGYTGRLVAARLAAGAEPYALAGRDEAQLAALVDALRSEGGRAPQAIHRADVGDAGSLAEMLLGAGALINCVGPFERLGPPVVAAAVAAAVPYCDITGETGFIARVADRHGDASVPLVPAAGFDYAPHSLAAALAASAVEDPVRIETALLAERFVPTVGTQASALGVLSEGGPAIEEGHRVEVRPGALRRDFSFAEGRSRSAVWYPGGDALQVHRQFPGAATVRSYAVVPRGVGWMASAGFAALRGLSRAGFVQRSMARRNETSNQGPPEEVRRRARFEVAAEAEGADGRVARACIAGSDVYATTARIAIVLASRLQRFAELAIPAGFIAPAQAAGDPLAFARDCGLELELLPEGD